MAGKRRTRVVHHDAQEQAPISFVNLQAAGGWTLAQAFELVIRDTLKPSSVAAYSYSLAHWKRFSANPPMREISLDVAQRFINAVIQGGYSPATAERDWLALVSIMGRFFQKTNAHRKALGILPGRPPCPVIPKRLKDKADYLKFDPLTLTLYECWDRFVRKEITHPGTLVDHECALSDWEKLTPNPPIRDINNLTLDKFKAALAERGLAEPTINKKLRYIQQIFLRVGPQEYKNPGGLDILYRRPYTKKLREPARVPRTLTPEQLASIFNACHHATWPHQERSGLPPALFWQATVVLAYNLGLSREELFGLRHEEVDLTLGMVTVIRGKTQRVLRLPINGAVRTVLKRIWRPEQGPNLLYATSSNRQLYNQWRAIQRAAGVIKGDDKVFKLHDLRRTCATELERLCPGAGTHQLGHSSPAVTWKHYRNPSAATRAAVESLPQPFALIERLAQ